MLPDQTKHNEDRSDLILYETFGLQEGSSGDEHSNKYAQPTTYITKKKTCQQQDMLASTVNSYSASPPHNT